MSGKLKIKKVEKPDPADNCDHDTKLMVDLLAGEISEHDKDVLSERLTACPECRMELEALSRAWRLAAETLKTEAIVGGGEMEPVAAPAPQKEAGDVKQEKAPSEETRKPRKTEPGAETAEREEGKSGGRGNAPLPFLAKRGGKGLKSNTKIWEIAACFAVLLVILATLPTLRKGSSPASAPAAAGEGLFEPINTESAKAPGGGGADKVSPSQPPPSPSEEKLKFPIVGKVMKSRTSSFEGGVKRISSSSPPSPSDKMTKSLPEMMGKSRGGYGRSVALKRVVRTPAPKKEMERSEVRRKNISAGNAPRQLPDEDMGGDFFLCEEKQKDIPGKDEGETGAGYGDADFFNPEEKPAGDLAGEKTDESEKFAEIPSQGVGCGLGRFEGTSASSENEKRRATRNALKKIKVSHVELEDASLPAALAVLNKYAEKAGVKIELAKADAAAREMDGEVTITIMFDDLSLEDAIKNICLAGDLRYRVGNGKVVIATKSVPLDPLKTWGFIVDKKAFDLLGGSIDEVKAYFEARGAEGAFEMDGASLRYDPKTKKLFATSTLTFLRRIRTAVRLAYAELKCQKDTKNGLPFLKTALKPFSTFSIDVDTASYTRCLRMIERGERPSPDAVRPEEFINYFDYHYRSPTDGEVFSVVLDAAPSPFRPENTLLRIGVQGKRLGADLNHPSVFTVLIDTSGSMANAERLDLVKTAIPMMLEKLRPSDTVAILACGSETKTLLPPTPASKKKAIVKAVGSLKAEGVTNLEKGIAAAYAFAGKNYQAGAYNRVVLFSDGVSNISPATAEEILAKVASARAKGVTNTIVSVGGDGDDKFLEAIADKGDGNYVFIRDEEDVKELFDNQFAARFREIARDVKIQVEFNPDTVAAYRQIGYDNRKLSKADFRNDSVDAGEVGSGQSVTALYELKLRGNRAGSIAPPAIVRIRYKRAYDLRVEERVFLLEWKNIRRKAQDAPDNMKLARAVAEFAESLKYPDVPGISNHEAILRALRPLLSSTYANDKKVKTLAEAVRLSK